MPVWHVPASIFQNKWTATMPIYVLFRSERCCAYLTLHMKSWEEFIVHPRGRNTVPESRVTLVGHFHETITFRGTNTE